MFVCLQKLPYNFLSNQALKVLSKLLSRPIKDRRVECLEVKNSSRTTTKKKILLTVLGGKLLYNVQSPCNVILWIVKSCVIAYMEHFFFHLKIRRMRMLWNASAPHILYKCTWPGLKLKILFFKKNWNFLGC